MAEINILTESQLRELISLDLDVVDAIESAFATLAGGKVVMPPILSMAIAEHNGEVDVKTAYVPGIDGFAIKVSPGFFDNPKIGLPSTSGLMIFFSAITGQIKALLLDNGYLTDIRTAAAGAVAAKHLSNPQASVACIVGAGIQARLQLQALTLVRPVKRAVVWARDHDKAMKFADEMRSTLDIEVLTSASLQDAVAQAEIIVTTTPSTTPLIDAEWLRPGQHLTAMGSDQHTKCELDPECLARADLYVPDRQSQTALLGELRSAMARGIVAKNRTFAELGDIIAGTASGRRSSDTITICDLTGTGIQDTAIASLAVKRAAANGAGTVFTS